MSVAGGAEPITHIANSVVTDETKKSPEWDLKTFCLASGDNSDDKLLESSIFTSPESSILSDDHLLGDESSLFETQFDINEWIVREESAHIAQDFLPIPQNSAADLLSLQSQSCDSERQAPLETPFQQPDSGASSIGCDVRGIAVGV